jgi:hypothetical protein
MQSESRITLFNTMQSEILSKVEKYHNSLLVEGEDFFPMGPKTSKLFLSYQFLSLITVERKLAGILMQKFNELIKHAKNIGDM